MHNTKKNRVLVKLRHDSISKLANTNKCWKSKKRVKLLESSAIKSLQDFLKGSCFFAESKIKGAKNNKHSLIKIPKVFSFSNNPDETIFVLKKVTTNVYKQKSHTIVIDFSKCKDMDLAACCALSSIFKDAECNLKLHSISISAIGINHLSQVGQMIIISGLINHLGFETGEKEEKLKTNKILMPLLTKKEFPNPSEKIMEYLEECFDAEGLGLTPEGYQKIGSMVGEVFSNIDDHSIIFRKWYALGHAEITKESTTVHLAILNYGNSFFESVINEKDTESFAKEKMYKLYSREQAKYRNLDKELYITLLCLQKYISRMNKDSSGTRGQGLVELLDNFIVIGEYCENEKSSSMSITSGGISIRFDGEEVINSKGNVYLGEEYHYLKENEQYITKLNNKFPGTVISMKFIINRKYLFGDE